EGDPLVARLKSPEVQCQEFTDTKQKHTQSSKTEATLLQCERQQKNQHTLNSPRNGDHAGLHFHAEHARDQDDGDEKLYLFGAAGDYGKSPHPCACVLRDGISPAKTESEVQACQQNGGS